MTDSCLVIAVVDNYPPFLEVLADVLGDEGMRVVSYLTSTHAFAALPTLQPDLIILDTWLEHSDAGWCLLEQLHHDRATAHIPILLGSTDKRGLTTRADQLREYHIKPFDKPFDLDELIQTIRTVVSDATQANTNRTSIA